ncbi:MAG: exodeoxyribonuclease VII small subunit [Bacilli bacterium]|nr:exodeoxyribonuclease VII small subunit [Bacilli bacterium]
MEQKEELKFEEALEQLEEVVMKLEEGDVPLDQLIHYYQKGMELVKLSNKMLRDAEEKMAKVLNENDELEPFAAEEDLDI